MKEQPQPPASDEIDLGQLFQLIGNFFNRAFQVFLRFLLLIKRNIITLLVLGLLGIVGGFFLGKLSETKLKRDVIVSPNFDSKDYLYHIVNEIQNNLGTKDTAFLKNLDITEDEIKGFKIEIEPLKLNTEIVDDDFITLLRDFKDEGYVKNAVRDKVLNSNPVLHRISFYFENPNKANTVITKLLKYINSNGVYRKVMLVTNENIKSRMVRNKEQIVQIDSLISNYTKSLVDKKETGSNLMLYNKDNSLDVSSLMNLRKDLVSENEHLNLELIRNDNPVHILNYGKTQHNENSLYNGMIVKLPLFLISLYFIILFSLYLDKKAEELRDK